ncbi:hypothetical protein L2E82_48277 [Cichorium intybus]|uniref:Uncharacterized protein n=1 Tax=Cichorium intybus TaxID=13427 RepID=A0ACB8YYC8_CICIN|nr:hypothetical protein L2E82_48277 [Cichorium intybus]
MRGDVQECVRIGVHHLGSIRQVQKGEEEDSQRGRFAVGDHEARKTIDENEYNMNTIFIDELKNGILNVVNDANNSNLEGPKKAYSISKSDLETPNITITNRLIFRMAINMCRVAKTN